MIFRDAPMSLLSAIIGAIKWFLWAIGMGAVRGLQAIISLKGGK